MTLQDFLHGGFIWLEDVKMLKLKMRLLTGPGGV